VKRALRLEKENPMEGSSELRSFFTRGSADLEAELCKHRELVGMCSWMWLRVALRGECVVRLSSPHHRHCQSHQPASGQS
ncbi:hypothetical protein Z043_113584, partial [Scleropages formosus]